MMRKVCRASASASGTPREIAAHQDDSGCIDRHICAGADRDSDIGASHARVRR